MKMSFSLQGDVTQRVLVVSYRRFGTLENRTGKLSHTIGNYQSSLFNFPEERRSRSAMLYR